MTATYEVVIDEPYRGAQVITPHIDPESLEFGSVDPGGFGSVNFHLARDIDARDYEENTEILVYDGHTGEQVGGARILNPGRSITDAGEFWEVTALGEGPTHLQEREVPYCIIDTRIEENPWEKGGRTNRRLEWAPGNQPNDDAVPGWTFTIAAGALNSGYSARLNNYMFEQFEVAGGSEHRTEIAGFEFSYDAGNSTNENRIQSRIGSYGGATELETSDHGFTQTPATRFRQITTNWPSTGIGTFSDEAVVRLTLRYLRNSPSVTVGGDDDWIHVFNIRISALRLDRNKAPITTAGAYTNNHVYAHEALIDCLARFCPRIDLVNARIDETATFEHKDLTWADGVTPYGVLEKLIEFNPEFTWGVWERLPSGLYRGEWRERDTDVRYEIPAGAGYSQNASESAPIDAAYVVAESLTGAYRVLGYGETGNPATSRTVKFDGKLDETYWSEAADALGNDTIEASTLRSTAAQVIVTGKVLDLYTGRWVTPEKILPGYNTQINDATPEGAAVYRIVTNQHTARDRTSRLELNTYTLTEARAIAELLNRTKVLV